MVSSPLYLKTLKRVVLLDKASSKLAVCGLVIFCTAYSHASAGDNSLQQVSFQSVLELPSGSPDNSYSYGSHTSQFIQYWNAPKQPDTAANVIFIHGGCWLKNTILLTPTRQAVQ